MAFSFNLDNLSRKLNDLGQNVINQGSALADTAKSKFKANEIEKKMDSLYIQLGRKYFEKIKDNPTEEDRQTVEEIVKLQKEYEVYAADLRRERGISLCPSCGAEVSYGTAYCPSCGNVMVQPGVTAFVKCTGCGKELPTGTRFCTSCGTDVSGVAPTARQMPLGQVDLSSGSILSSPGMPVQPPMTQYPMTPPTTMQPPMTPPTTMQPPMAPPPTMRPPMAPPPTMQPPMAPLPTMQPPMAPPPIPNGNAAPAEPGRLTLKKD
ncbi:MAG: zinc ribbon domain-containing protein [Clostridia bacterium]|nr:zinc ribbon domain-containing protein [Clostridia bacterium]